MRISPPKVIINETSPFKDALFGREEFAQSLTHLMRSVSDNLVVFVNAPWGAGKTTFSLMWRASLRLQKLDVIYFDSYAADYFDDPFVSFSGEILGLLDKRFAEGHSLTERREFKTTAVEVAKRLTGLATKIALRAATLGAVESAHLEEFKELGSEIASGVSEIGADVIEKKIENYSKEKDALKNFKHSLAKVAAKVRAEQDFPLTIIVDELDRCRPSFALELLERIKHLFDVDNVVFLLLVNREQIESYIETVYGGVDAQAYLLKFGTLFIDLPNEQAESNFVYVKGQSDYCEVLLNHYGLDTRTPNHRFLVTCIAFFSSQFHLTLREIERVFAILTLYYGSFSARAERLAGSGGTMDLVVALLSVVKVKQPSLYYSMRNGGISADEFYKHTNLDLMKVKGDSFNHQWAKDVVDVCIMSEAELGAATENDDGTKKVRPGLKGIAESFRDRRSVIPNLCDLLDRFALPA
jgi:hypothetical protein